jgi:hypothetical protein
MNGFPVVYETDWCGDHKLDESKCTQIANGKAPKWDPNIHAGAETLEMKK